MASEHSMDRVEDRELQNTLSQQLQHWKHEGNALQRTFEFLNFKSALAFVNAVGDRAEALGHHPDIDVRYNQVKLNLTSHDAGGITRRDIELATSIDQVASSFKSQRAA